eukprot:scaffold602_cov342-Prasinococcus_capsulatus_cf.AAC.17
MRDAVREAAGDAGLGVIQMLICSDHFLRNPRGSRRCLPIVPAADWRGTRVRPDRDGPSPQPQQQQQQQQGRYYFTLAATCTGAALPRPCGCDHEPQGRSIIAQQHREWQCPGSARAAPPPPSGRVVNRQDGRAAVRGWVRPKAAARTGGGCAGSHRQAASRRVPALLPALGACVGVVCRAGGDPVAGGVGTAAT